MDILGSVNVAINTITPLGPCLLRSIPEKLAYGDGRVLWAMDADEVDSGGNEDEVPMQSANGWPAPDWVRYRVEFQTTPYRILTNSQILSQFGQAEPLELYRYMIRSRKNTAREQPIPLGVTGAGFLTVDEFKTPIPSALSFKAVQYADVSYTQVRVPIGWPPPAGWTPPTTPPFGLPHKTR